MYSNKKKVKWKASNKCIKIIKKNKKKAKIKGIKKGTAYLRAIVGKKVCKCRIKVQNVDAYGVSIEGVKNDLYVGESIKVKASVYPSNATNRKKVKWTSSNPSVAKVGKDGVVQAISTGKLSSHCFFQLSE